MGVKLNLVSFDVFWHLIKFLSMGKANLQYNIYM